MNKLLFGLGAMGLHTFLAQNHIQYGSPESLNLQYLFHVIELLDFGGVK